MDRLITFADAVVAIAITLLALPLVDVPRQLADAAERSGAPEPTVPAVLAAMALPGLGLLISFFVIARMWWAHHRITEHVVAWTTGFVVLTILWLFTIVVLSVATSITTAFSPDEHPEVVALYIGTMIAGSLTLTLLAVLVHRRPDLTDGRGDDALARVVGSAETTAAFAVALLIGVLVPAVNFFALAVLALTGRLDAPILRAIERGRTRRRSRDR